MSRFTLKKTFISTLTGFAMIFMFTVVSAFAVPATNDQINAAVAGGKAYLAGNFVKDSSTAGHWDGSYYGTLAATGFAVSALLETSATGATGREDGLTYEQLIAMGVEHIKTFVKTDGGIYKDYGAYETGASLMALSLYGHQVAQNAAYKTIVQNAITYLKTKQTTCSPATGPHGGWTYIPTSSCGSSDLSNTQFAVMGLFFGSQYLGLPIAGEPWTTKLLAYLKNSQASSGGFSYEAISVSPWITSATNGGGIWCLAMIDQANAKKDPADTNTMLQNAVGYFNSSYGWTTALGFDYYFVYAMSKGLSATIGAAGTVGTHNWVQDLKDAMWSQASPVPPVPQTAPPTATSWSNSYAPAMETAWAMMAFAFANPTTAGYSKLVPAAGAEDTKPPAVNGLVTLQSISPVTISNAARASISAATVATSLTLPVGVMDFQLNNVPEGSTTVLTLTPPAGAFDITNPASFVNADGTLKSNINWFKIRGGQWQRVSTVPIEVDTVNKVIRVTLKDGGDEDTDGAANGTIVDPGGPGFSTKVAQTVGSISFTTATLGVGGTTTASATSTSGLTVSFSSSTPTVCTVSGATVTGVAEGICTIVANQAGDSSYDAASQVSQNITVSPGNNDHRCFIATAAYGSYMAHDVMVLREFRDKHLLTHPLGRAFVKAYYTVSPPLADLIARSELLKSMTRVLLAPAVFTVKQPTAALLLFSCSLIGFGIYRRRVRKA